MATIQLRRIRVCGGNLDPWRVVKDGDWTAFRLYRKHYSCTNPRPKTRQILGPGEKLVLVGRYVSPNAVVGNYLCGFRLSRFRRDDQDGINLAVFRNAANQEGGFESSYLLAWAEVHAFHKWGVRRMFTFVNSSAVASANPGYCFKKAGWQRCGSTAKGLLVFEKTIEDSGRIPGWHPWKEMREGVACTI
jgi:hypothetical protein